MGGGGGGGSGGGDRPFTDQPKPENSPAWIELTNSLLFFTDDLEYFYNSSNHYWDFEQKNIAEILDSRTNTKVTIHGEDVTQRNSLHGKSALFSESQDTWIKLNQIFDSAHCLYNLGCTTGLTVAMWLKYDKSNHMQRVFGNFETVIVEGISMFIWPKSSLLRITVNKTENSCFYTYDIHERTWVHVVVTWQPHIFRLTLFVDGNEVSSKRNKGNRQFTNCTLTGYPMLNSVMSESGTYFIGQRANAEYDDLAIWSHVLGNSELKIPWDYITGKQLIELLIAFM